MSLFDDWDNSGHSSSQRQPAAALPPQGARGGSRAPQQRQPQTHSYESDEELTPDTRLPASSMGGMGVGSRAQQSYSSGQQALSSQNHSSVITSTNDPTLSPTDQVGGLAGPPMFKLERLDWRPTKEQGALVGLAVGSGVLLIATQNCTIVRWNVDTDEFDEINITKRADDRIHKVFLDPTGHHGLIAMDSGSVYYLHSRWNKAHLLTKVRGIIIESVAWNQALGTDTCTKKILIGTNRGVIYETYIEEKDKYFKKIHDLNSDDMSSGGPSGVGSQGGAAGPGQGAELLHPTTPVSGLYMELFPSSKDAGEANHKWFVMAATPNRQFQFIGGPTFEALFARYTGNVPNAFKDFPGALSYSELRFFSRYQGKGAQAPTAETCAWLNGAGIFYGQLVFGSQDKGQDVLQDGKLLAYPAVPDPAQGGQMRVQAPLSLTLTEFHFLIMMKNRLMAINQLSEEIVYEEVVNTGIFGELAGLATDSRKNTVWLYSDKLVFAVDVVKEDRDAWKLYLREGKFDQALEYCDTDAQEERVHNAKADHLFEQGAFEAAAQIYAKTGRSFEEVALKFVNIASGLPVPAATSIGSAGATGPGTSPISLASPSATLQADARAALKAYLLAKLNTLEPTELTQQVMICTWLTEIFLDNINRLQEGAVESASAALRKRNEASSTGGSSSGGRSGATPGLVSTTSPFPDVGGDEDEDGEDDDLDGSAAPHVSDEAALLADERAQKREDEVKEFRSFLHDYFDCLNRDTTFELIASHGRVNELLFYAQIINDLDWVLHYQLQQRDYMEALHILETVDNPGKVADLFYKFCPTLMHFLPRQTVDMLIDLGKTLDPSKLIPALMRYDDAAAAQQDDAAVAKQRRIRGGGRDSDDEEDAKSNGSDDEEDDESNARLQRQADSTHHAIRYLEHMVVKLKNRDAVLHNYLISLYARQKDDAPLLQYIRMQQAKKAASANGSLVYDYKYALRVCHEHGHLRACVLIYESMYLYEEATRLALEIDLELAKSVVARSAEETDPRGTLDEQQRKRLWILIARHVISKEQDIGKAMAILKECDVQLEQILPFFPDFVKIGDFKDEISKSLSAYNTKIEHLKSEMEEYTASATMIRQDIHALRSRYGVVSSHQKCDLCSQPVLTRHFFLFPCTHVFHTACCVAECAKYLASHPTLRAQVMADDEAREAQAAQQASVVGTGSGGAGASSHPAAAALAKSQAAAAAAAPVLSKEAREARCLEHYAASECVLCGEIMIDSVAKPFICMPDEEAEVRAWEV